MYTTDGGLRHGESENLGKSNKDAGCQVGLLLAVDQLCL